MTDKEIKVKEGRDGARTNEMQTHSTVTKKEGLFQVVPGNIRSIHFLCWQPELAHFRDLDGHKTPDWLRSVKAFKSPALTVHFKNKILVPTLLATVFKLSLVPGFWRQS